MSEFPITSEFLAIERGISKSFPNQLHSLRRKCHPDKSIHVSQTTLALKKIYFYFMYMNVLPPCIYVHNVCTMSMEA